MELIVFDLDFTLWDAAGTWCDHTSPPFRKKGEVVVDSRGGIISLYPDVNKILTMLSGQKIRCAVASRTGEPEWASQLMDLFDITRFFDYREIYPASKLVHFNKLKNESGIGYDRMLFFDDEMRNVDEVGALGVAVCHVIGGVSLPLVEKKVNEHGVHIKTGKTLKSYN
ncbi:MAG: magnesium-dependent phosphatase-1 [Spirochaetes bacterium]|nr:magnesium-dependent phosphatase-1 [Spirochaetota bacterium]